MTLSTDALWGGRLADMRVGISGAVPERQEWGEVKDLDQVILRFVAQLSGLVFKYGGVVVHGSHPSFTPVLQAQAERFRRENDDRRLTLVASELWGSPPEVAARSAHVANIFSTPPIGSGGPADPKTRSDSLTALRLTVARSIDVLVAVGGKKHSRTGRPPGVLEELTLARWHTVPCFVVGGYGGFTHRIDKEILRSYETGNGLDDASSLAMATWSEDSDENAGTLVGHLMAHRDQFVPSLGRTTREALRSGGGTADVVNLVPRFAERFSVLREAFERGDASTIRHLLERV